MSIATWKRGRGWTEAHGWGSQAWARLIGRQRREARRAAGPVVMPLLDDSVLTELQAAESEERTAWMRYETLPSFRPREEFNALREAWERASERREELRAAYRQAREPSL